MANGVIVPYVVSAKPSDMCVGGLRQLSFIVSYESDGMGLRENSPDSGIVQPRWDGSIAVSDTGQLVA